jgi:hypothetical protein
MDSDVSHDGRACLFNVKGGFLEVSPFKSGIHFGTGLVTSQENDRRPCSRTPCKIDKCDCQQLCVYVNGKSLFGMYKSYY